MGFIKIAVASESERNSRYYQEKKLSGIGVKTNTKTTNPKMASAFRRESRGVI
jgi:hypothetical protein